MESVIAKQSIKGMRLLRFARNDRDRSVKRSLSYGTYRPEIWRDISRKY